MTFEEDFPSFKKYKEKERYPMIRFGEYEFTDDYINDFIKDSISECCLDKQRVRKAIDEYFEWQTKQSKEQPLMVFRNELLRRMGL